MNGSLVISNHLSTTIDALSVYSVAFYKGSEVAEVTAQPIFRLQSIRNAFAMYYTIS